MAAKRNGRTVRCPVCSKPTYFAAARLQQNARFCSIHCAVVYNSPRRVYPRTGKVIPCSECGKPIYRHPSTLNRQRCSKRCANAYIQRLYKGDAARANRLRSIAPKGPRTSEHRAKLSATRKRQIAEGKFDYFIKRGSDNIAWKGGISSLQNKLRHTPRYAQWRTNVYRADGFACVNCGATRHLHAHHIFAFAKYPRLRYAKRNGATLCEDCHSFLHKRRIPTPRNKRPG